MTSMDSFQRKANLSFAQSDNNSPKKLASPSPNSTAGGTKKGGFLSGLFSGKKKNPGDSNAFSPTKNMESPNKLLDNNQNAKKPKSKLVNRKNIADGRIRLNIMDNDRVPEDYQIEYKDNPFEILDHNPNRTTSYIENLRSRDFSMINNREVKRFVEAQQNKKEIAPPLAVQNLELDLIEMQGSYYKFFGKFYRFFQGLLPGFCILHLFLIFGGSGTSTSTILASYVLNCLRLYQIMYLIAVISALGAAHRYVETKLKYQEAVHSHPFLKDSLNSQVWKYLIATICFVIVYVIVVFNNEFVSILSNEAYNIDANALAQRFQAFQILSAITAGLSLAGWISLILAFEEVSSVQQDMVNYQNDLTGDESMEETP